MIPMTLSAIATAMDAAPLPAGGEVPVTGVSIDSRTTAPGDLFVAIRGERFDGHNFLGQAISRGAAACVVSRTAGETSCPCLRVRDTVPALGRWAAAHRRLSQATVIAVTGSNGKTTTKAMIGHVLAQHRRGKAAVKSFNNHLGVPLTLLSAEPQDEYLVVEIGTSAPGEVACLAAMSAPDIGVVTSIGPAHLEGLGGIAGIVREKLSLLEHVSPHGLAVLNADHPETPRSPATPARLVTFGESRGVDLLVSDVKAGLDRVGFRINGGREFRLRICGRHNALNAAAAFAVCRQMGLTDQEFASALSSFAPADMRLNVVRCGSVTVVNDGYNANPSSMSAAIDVLQSSASQRRVLVAGDMLELGPDARKWHERTGRRAGESGVELVIAVGEHAAALTAAARRANPAVATLVHGDSQAAADAVAEWLNPGDVVLVKGSRAMAMERVVDALTGTVAVSAGSQIEASGVRPG